MAFSRKAQKEKTMKTLLRRQKALQRTGNGDAVIKIKFRIESMKNRIKSEKENVP